MNKIFEESEKFIYIENQFFISSLAGPVVKNTIALTLLNRIRKAINNKEDFRVVVVIPAHPDGAYKDSASVRLIMKFQYHTISRGGNSLLETLRKEYPYVNIDQYLKFYSLRGYGILNNQIHTEQIYVHAKLLIVDDRSIVIGSANINDRSLIGERDSEIGIVVRGKHDLKIQMNGTDYFVNSFAHSFRVSLWQEHLGMDSPSDNKKVQDPHLCDYWDQISKNNDTIYRTIFPIVKKLETDTHNHKDTVCCLDSTGKGDPQSFSLIRGIQGHLIHFPLDFLEEEKLDPTIKNTEYLVNQEIFI